MSKVTKKEKKPALHVVTGEDLQRHPEWVEQGISVGDEVELDETEKEETTKETTKSEKPLKQIPPSTEDSENASEAEAPKKAEVAVKKPRRQKSVDFVLTGNVRHNGVRYEKGSVIPADHELVDLFDELGLLE